MGIDGVGKNILIKKGWVFKMKKWFQLVLLPVILGLTGCVYLVVGGIGALGGYVVSPDTVEGVTDHELMTVWDGSVEIMSILGNIYESYESSGLIRAKVSGADVTITLSRLSDSTIKISVKARKWMMPRINLAQDIFVKIMTYVNG